MSPYALDRIIGTFWGVLTVSLRASGAHLRLLEKMIIFRHSRGPQTNLFEKVFIFPKLLHYSRGGPTDLLDPKNVILHSYTLGTTADIL